MCQSDTAQQIIRLADNLACTPCTVIVVYVLWRLEWRASIKVPTANSVIGVAQIRMCHIKSVVDQCNGAAGTVESKSPQILHVKVVL